MPYVQLEFTAGFFRVPKCAATSSMQAPPKHAKPLGHGREQPTSPPSAGGGPDASPPLPPPPSAGPDPSTPPEPSVLTAPSLGFVASGPVEPSNGGLPASMVSSPPGGPPSPAAAVNASPHATMLDAMARAT